MPRPRFHKLDAAKRERILAVALHEFGEKGYERASMNRIIDQAGLSKGATYYYFDGKQDLFNTVVEHGVRLVTAGLASELRPLDPERDYWLQLDELGARLIHKMLHDPALGVITRNLGNMFEPAIMSKAVSALYAGVDSMIEALIEEGQRRGAVRTDLPLSLLVKLVVAVFAEVDRWILGHFDDFDGEGVARASSMAVDLAKRLAQPPA